MQLVISWDIIENEVIGPELRIDGKKIDCRLEVKSPTSGQFFDTGYIMAEVNENELL